MFQNKIYLLLFIVLSLVTGCKKTMKETGNISGISNEIQYAKGLKCMILRILKY